MVNFEEIQTSVDCDCKRVTVTHTKCKYSREEDTQPLGTSKWKGVITSLVTCLFFKFVPISIFVVICFPLSDFSAKFAILFPLSNCCVDKFGEVDMHSSKMSQKIANSHQLNKHTPTVSKKSEPLMKEANEANLLIKAMKDRAYIKARTLIIDVGVDVNFQDKSGNSPLHIASFDGSRDMIDLLLDNEASMAVQNNEGNTPLHILAREGYYEIISELGFLNEEDMECIASVKNTKGHTALDLAYASMVNEEYFKNSVFDDLSSMRCSDIAQLE